MLLAGLGAAAVFLVHFWIGRRSTDPTIISPVNRIEEAKHQAAIDDTETTFIQMPDYLRTKDEMITWLVQELPRLTSRQHEGRK